MDPAVAVKAALLLPAGTVTEAGTVKLVVLDPSVTVTPPDPAGPLRFTVQPDVPEEPRDPEVHETELTVTAAAGVSVMLPPLELIVSTAPAGEAPIALVTPIEAFVAPLVRVAVTTATTPFEMILVLLPETSQMYAADPPAQETDLPAEVEAAPAATLIVATLEAG